MPNHPAASGEGHPTSGRWHEWLAALRPAPLHIDATERWRAVAGAALGILVAALICRWLAPAGSPATAWLVAPLGASAVLVFAVPASPLAQPWSVLGGNGLSAVVGVLCAAWVPDVAVAAALAVSLAIGVMFLARCLHPPGGAMALLITLTHTPNHQPDWQFVVFPALLNSVLLVAVGMAYNTSTGRRYPHRQRTVPSSEPAARFSSADLDTALAHYNQVLDVPRDDLEALLQHAEMAAYRRHLGEVRCADIMSPDPVTVEFGTPLLEAWTLLRQRRIKALPVVDRTHRLVGIVTVADFLRHANLDQPQGFGERLRAFVRPSGRSHSERPEAVGQIMTRQVRVASADRHIVELVGLFSEGGHHHIPIVRDGKLVGILTQSDFVRALYRAVGRPPND